MEGIYKVMLIALAVVLAVFFASNFSSKEISLPTVTFESTRTSANTSYGKVSLNVPAVDEAGNGLSTILTVEEKSGEGGTLVDVNQLTFWTDTQDSIRTAKMVAENYTKLDLSKVDLMYRIETNASLIGGPSAGAALTVATISVLENKSLKPNVMITGTINPDGTIGQVGGIEEKAKAAKATGATIFLVPEGQASETYYAPQQKCERYGFVTYCRTEYTEQQVNVSKDAGISVKEVSNIQEALKYFLA